MDPAILGVMLDSSVLIDAERQRLDVEHFLKHIIGQIGEREAALSAISVAELAHGIHRELAGAPAATPRFSGRSESHAPHLLNYW